MTQHSNDTELHGYDPQKQAAAVTEPERGSTAWELRRKASWDQQARDLIAALSQYEAEHPADAICLAPAWGAAQGIEQPMSPKSPAWPWRSLGEARFTRPDRVTLSMDYHSEEMQECGMCGAVVVAVSRLAHEAFHRHP